MRRARCGGSGVTRMPESRPLVISGPYPLFIIVTEDDLPLPAAEEMEHGYSIYDPGQDHRPASTAFAHRVGSSATSKTI